MEQPPTAKWYDNNLLVAVLCAFLFPIGLYALWKSPTRSKGWKVGGTIAVALLVIVALNSDDTKPKDKAPQPAAASKDTVPSDEPVAPSDTATSADQAAHSDQDLFLSEKINSFREYVLSEQVIQETSDAIGPFKSSSSKSTASFLAERQNRLVNWTARVISVDMDQSKECDISLSILSDEIGRAHV